MQNQERKRKKRHHSSSSEGSDDDRERRPRRQRRSAWDDSSGGGVSTTVAEVDAAIQAANAPPTNPNRVYVGNIFYEVSEEEIRHVFGRVGKVLSVDMMIDPETGRHKGFAFIDLESPEAVEKALKMVDGYSYAGRQLRVGRPHNPSVGNLPGKPNGPGGGGGGGSSGMPMVQLATGTATVPVKTDDPVAKEHGLPSVPGIKFGTPGEPRLPRDYPLKGVPKVYGMNLSIELTEQIATAIFRKYGSVKAIKMDMQPGRDNRQFCIVEYGTESQAEEAVLKLDKYVLNKCSWRCGRCLPTPMTTSFSSLPPPLPMPTLQQQIAATNISALNPMFPGLRLEENISNEENVNISGGAARVSLMAKLMRSDEKDNIKVPISATLNDKGRPLTQEQVQKQQMEAMREQQLAQARFLAQQQLLLEEHKAAQPSKCVVLDNLVGGPDEVDSDLGAEVKDECGRFGHIEHVLIYDEKEKNTGKIQVKFFVLYSSITEAARACSKLDGRFFAKRKISCKYYNEQAFWNILRS